MRAERSAGRARTHRQAAMPKMIRRPMGGKRMHRPDEDDDDDDDDDLNEGGSSTTVHISNMYAIGVDDLTQ